MLAAADEACGLLKALANRHRLLIVCQLIERSARWANSPRCSNPQFDGVAAPGAAAQGRPRHRAARRADHLVLDRQPAPRARSCARSIKSIARRPRRVPQNAAAPKRPARRRPLRQIKDGSREPGTTSRNGKASHNAGKCHDAPRHLGGVVLMSSPGRRWPRKLLPSRRKPSPTRRPCSPLSRVPISSRREPGSAAPSRILRSTRRPRRAGPGCRHRRRRKTRAADEVARRSDRWACRRARQSQDRSRPGAGTVSARHRREGHAGSAQTAFDVATNSLKSRTAERSVIQQQVTEGKILAPTAGRVLTVPVTTGTVCWQESPSPPLPSRISFCDCAFRSTMPGSSRPAIRCGSTARISARAA